MLASGRSRSRHAIIGASNTRSGTLNRRNVCAGQFQVQGISARRTSESLSSFVEGIFKTVRGVEILLGTVPRKATPSCQEEEEDDEEDARLTRTTWQVQARRSTARVRESYLSCITFI